MSSALTIRLFGPMLVLVNGEPMPRLRSRKALWLLALLATRANRPVAREWLATTLWPDVDLASAFSNLRPVMSELRRALGAEGERVRSLDRSTVLFDLHGADFDLDQFDAAVRSKQYEVAVGLYRGPLLEDCSEEWVPQERGAREADCLLALQSLGERASENGDREAALTYFKRAMALDPWRDAPRRNLMQTLASMGDVNAALQAYREFAQLLSAETSAVPDPATTALYQRLRAEAKRGDVKRERPAEKAAPQVVGHLPHALTELIGREDERIDIATLLRSHRLVTLSGPGGIGKTRLAMEVAHSVVAEYADGAWLISLEAIDDERLITKEIATIMGVAEEAGRSSLQTLTRALRERKALLVLDNCEHLLEGVADLVAGLTRDCAHLRILTTSREPLAITGERVWTVPPLATPSPEGLPEGRATLMRVMMGYESVRLFIERAQAAHPSFEINPENARFVALICDRLEGLPLAIELAAARLRSMTSGQIAERLDDALRLLAGGRGASKRQQTLRATIDWSYSLLSDEEKAVFRRLAVFVGGWTLEAAEAVIGPEADEALTALVDKSLVIFDEGRGRFRFLETVRQFAFESLSVTPDREVAETRMRTWAIRLAEASESQMNGPEQAHWGARLDAESDNLRAALQRCDASPEDGLALAGALTRYWYFRNRFAEGRASCEAALARAGTEPTESRAKALNGAGTFAYAQGDLTAAANHWNACLELRRQLGDPRGLAIALGNLASLAYYRRDFAAGADLYEESAALARAAGDDRSTALALSNLGTMRKGMGDYPAARRCAEESLSLFRKLKDARMTSWLLKELADLAQVRADHGEARALYEEALAHFREAGDQNGTAWTLASLAETHIELELLELAEETLADARTGFAELALETGLVAVTLREARLALQNGQIEDAQRKLEADYGKFSAEHTNPYRAERLALIGDLAREEGNEAMAECTYRDLLALALEEGEPLNAARAFWGFGTPDDLAAAAQIRAELGLASGRAEAREIDWKSVARRRLQLKVEPQSSLR